MLIDTYGCDFIITEKGLCLLEINGAPAILLWRHDFPDDKSFELAMEERALSTSLSLKKIWEENNTGKKGIAIVCTKTGKDKVEDQFKHPQIHKLKEYLIKYGIPTIISKGNECLDDWIRYERTGKPRWLFRKLNDKSFLKELITNYKSNIFIPSEDEFQYEEDDIYPNVVVKPVEGSQGIGIRFKKLPLDSIELEVEDKDNITQSFIKGTPIEEYKNYKGNGKYGTTPLKGKHLFDVRCTIAVVGKKWYPIFTLMRIARMPLPQQLKNGTLPLEENKRFLTNISQGSIPGYLEENKKEEIIKESLKLTQYVVEGRNKEVVKDLLWSGGHNSTFRLLELLQLGFTVRPIYLLLQETQKSTLLEMETLDKILKYIKIYHSDLAGKILPVKYINYKDINLNKEVEVYCKKHPTLPLKYQSLLNYTYQHGKEIELSVDEKSPLSSIIEKDTIFYSRDCKINTNKKELSFLFNIRFPVIHTHKSNLWYFSYNYGFQDVLSLITYCLSPLLPTNLPCGKCDGCITKKNTLHPSKFSK